MKQTLAFTTLLVLAIGCGIGGPPEFGNDTESTTPYPLLVVNRSQFPVLELHVHEEAEFQSQGNLLSEPLAIDGEMLLDAVRGVDYLTYVRTESDFGDLYSITTDAPLGVDRRGYALLLFDEGFRLLAPDHPDNPNG